MAGRSVGGPHNLIVIAVKIPLEAKDFLAAGESAGQAEAVHRGFGAGAGEADEVEARDGLAEEIGKLCVLLVFVRAGSAAIHGLLHGCLNTPVAMTDQRGPVTATQVDVFAAIKVPDPAAGSAVEVERMAKGLVDARGRRDAAGEMFFSQSRIGLDAAHNPKR